MVRLRLGLYEVYLRDWFSIFSRDQILVQSLEDRSKDPRTAMTRIFRFLDLGVSEKLRRIFQNLNIATNFKPHSTLRQRLVHPKDRPHKGTKANVIYRLKCEEPNCNNTYIGETSRPLNPT
ncbi:Carbohydrate sulfotransferase 15 [Branchiostoma belcheri]|nr:Carbohydrate sulfotransferase 15 [Branchiostoma belcheri]